MSAAANRRERCPQNQTMLNIAQRRCRKDALRVARPTERVLKEDEPATIALYALPPPQHRRGTMTRAPRVCASVQRNARKQ